MTNWGGRDVYELWSRGSVNTDGFGLIAFGQQLATVPMRLAGRDVYDLWNNSSVNTDGLGLIPFGRQA